MSQVGRRSGQTLKDKLALHNVIWSETLMGSI
jgi:hypothetical protein